MSRTPCQFLRPALFRSFCPVTKPEHARIYSALQRCVSQRLVYSTSRDAPITHTEKGKRLEQLQNAAPLNSYHPRLGRSPGVKAISPKEFRADFEHISGTLKDVKIQVFGRVQNVRTVGSKLMFIDFARDEHKVQTMNEFGYLAKLGVDREAYNRFKTVVRRGDWISVTGHPTRTTAGELSIRATEIPSVLSPSLHHLPRTINDPETLAIRPHVHQLLDRGQGDVLRLRAFIYQFLRQHLNQDGFIEVETPTFDVGAGGAIARPFETVANAMSDEVLKLRVAPELYLKRLVVAGNDKVFEVAKVFRNEGIDNTHNPEFTICEFYEVGATLDDLISRTERLFSELASAVQTCKEWKFPTLPDTEINWTVPFTRLPFIPTIEKGLGRNLPDLSSLGALEELLALFAEFKIPLPAQVTLPRLLDILAEHYIEPLCSQPTFITNHPEALSPLSKSYVCPETGQRVAARAELFIGHREYVNAYEEENSPFEQYRKFEDQVRNHKGEEESMEIDESYIEALEWGMPPTGGWGCGLDRLVMLFAGRKRIADVLPFGTLRTAMAIAKNRIS